MTIYNFFDRFDKMVVKVSDTKTIADSLWQGYNVSLSYSLFLSFIFLSVTGLQRKPFFFLFLISFLFSLWREFSMHTFLRCLRFSSLVVNRNQSWDINPDIPMLTWKTYKYVLNNHGLQNPNIPMLTSKTHKYVLNNHGIQNPDIPMLTWKTYKPQIDQN